MPGPWLTFLVLQQNLGADAILLKFGLLTRDLVKECRKRNLVILSWTPNSPEEFREAD